MSRLNHDTNEWECKIVLFGPPTKDAVKLAARLVTTLPADERTLTWDTPPSDDRTLVAKYRPANSSLVEIQPVYSLHTLRSPGSTASDRQHLLGNVDGVILLLDTENIEASNFAERELERFLGMFGKTIASMPVVFLSTTPLDEAQQASLNPRNQSLFSSENAARALTALTGLLEEDSGLGGLGFDVEAFEEDESSGDLDDIEFDDLHAYDDDDIK